MRVTWLFPSHQCANMSARERHGSTRFDANRLCHRLWMELWEEGAELRKSTDYSAPVEPRKWCVHGTNPQCWENELQARSVVRSQVSNI